MECRATCGTELGDPIDVNESCAKTNDTALAEKQACSANDFDIRADQDTDHGNSFPCSNISIRRNDICTHEEGTPAGAKIEPGCTSQKTDNSMNKENHGACAGKSIDIITKKNGCCAVEKDACCAQVNESCCPPEVKDSCCTNEKDTRCTNEKDACCADEKDDSPTAEVEACCANERAASGHAKGNDTCCSEKHETTVRDATKNDGCCDNDTSCSRVATPSKVESCSTGDYTASRLNTTAEACIDHLQKAFDEYASFLEKGRCVCRSVLNRLDTCCGEVVPKKVAADNQLPSTGTSTALAAPQKRPVRRQAKGACRESCSNRTNSRAAATQVVNTSPYSPDEVRSTSPRSEKSKTTRLRKADIEDAAAREHVLLSVAGMTCTGCSRKITNVLKNVDGVSSIKVTFVTAITEFDLDAAVANLAQVMPRIEKETGFKFSKITSDFQTLDLRADPVLATLSLEEVRDMVESIEQLDKGTYRINYDPAVVGARTILSTVRGATLAPPGNDSTMTDSKRRLLQMAWYTAVAAVLTIPVVVLAWADTGIPYSTQSVVSLVLATLVQALAISEFYVGALKSLIYSRVLEMDMLVVISITASYGYSVVAFAIRHAGHRLETGEFFETSCLLITLVLLGRLMAALAKVKAISAVSMRSLQAEKALLLESSGATSEIDARLLQFGDTFVIPAHSRIVTDGYVTHGESSVDESMITGESIPIPKTPGDRVIAGTINGPSQLTVHLTRLPGKNSITDIVNLVERAMASKPRIQDLADKLASYFVPVVVSISLVTFAIWMAVAVKLRGREGGEAVGVAITYAIAVMAISCPCALGLAVPMVLIIAGGVAARSGVLIKQADALEKTFKVTDVVFDKTGTLTEGDLTVIHEQAFPHPKASENDAFALARTLTKDNQHPVSQAIVKHLEHNVITATDVLQVESIPGSGIQARWKNSVVKAGNPYWLKVENAPQIAALINQGMTLLCLTLDDDLLAIFGLKSTVREEAPAVIASLHRRNLTCHVVSGDAPKVVEDVASTVGIPVSCTASRRSPAEKQKYVEDLMSSGKIVLFCGDGTNDAVAVAQADVGIQIGTASDVTRATADVVLLGGLDGVLVLLDLSKRAYHRIMFNFFWSAVYNLFAILLAGGAFVDVRIPPAYAGLGEIVSVGPVIAAALTLLRTKQNVS